MELASFKTSISKMSDDELLALLADLRSSRRAVVDIADIKERLSKSNSNQGKKPKSPKTVAALGASLSADQLKLLISKLEEG